MEIEIVAVHPSTVMVRGDDRQFELPISVFSSQPKLGQHWSISLEHHPTEEEQREQLNRYLAHD